MEYEYEYIVGSCTNISKKMGHFAYGMWYCEWVCVYLLVHFTNLAIFACCIREIFKTVRISHHHHNRGYYGFVALCPKFSISHAAVSLVFSNSLFLSFFCQAKLLVIIIIMGGFIADQLYVCWCVCCKHMSVPSVCTASIAFIIIIT